MVLLKSDLNVEQTDNRGQFVERSLSLVATLGMTINCLECLYEMSLTLLFLKSDLDVNKRWPKD
jgi:hypothetical protein